MGVLVLYLYLVTQKEGFEGKTLDLFHGKVYRNEKIYDPFYAYNFDDMVLTMPYLVETVQKIFPYFHTGKTLCVGSKNGHIVQLLSNSISTVGLESSRAMVELSQYKYPELDFVQGDLSIFPSHHFRQIVVPLWNIHMIQKLSDFLYSVKEHLIHTGYLFISFINLKTFPISRMVPTPSEYFTLNYEYGVELKNNQLIETIRDRKSQVRTNIQDLYTYNEQSIIEAARSVGFTHVLSLPFDNVPMSIAIFQNK
jgi:hypothetical protein